jgi:cell division protein FtsL
MAAQRSSASAAQLAFPASWLVASATTTRRRTRSSGAEIGRARRGKLTRLNLVTGGFALLVALFHAWTGLQVWRLGYALSDARALEQHLEREQSELAIEYAAQTAPERLERDARQRLGLEPPATGQVMVLR